jgi:hypothetical protein
MNPMKKTKEEIKQEIAVKHECLSWAELMTDIMEGCFTDGAIDSIIDEAMDAYARKMVEKFVEDNFKWKLGNEGAIKECPYLPYPYLTKWLTDNNLNEK